MLNDLATFLSSGIGGGALAVPLIGMAGGYPISGRGPLWARILCGLVAITTAHGAWVALYFWSFLAVLALASSIPHRRVSSTELADRDLRGTVPLEASEGQPEPP
jgi:hypothetical protein